jgi:hypothetical protein
LKLIRSVRAAGDNAIGIVTKPKDRYPFQVDATEILLVEWSYKLLREAWMEKYRLLCNGVNSTR